ncbi:MAG: type II toxin-antitoxin system Phd/YefM family antitoxin [Acidobacteriia bacterium]|nr:type II toxin-antitoxin system Phd/YefM family antitoxin [Terriglobia bacterium]
MQQIAISKFKAQCLSILETVRKTGQPILVTKFGTPIAEVGPPPKPESRQGWIGSMAGTGKITGDIVGPSTDPSEWDVLRD